MARDATWKVEKKEKQKCGIQALIWSPDVELEIKDGARWLAMTG